MDGGNITPNQMATLRGPCRNAVHFLTMNVIHCIVLRLINQPPGTPVQLGTSRINDMRALEFTSTYGHVLDDVLKK